MGNLLEIEDLTVQFDTRRGLVRALDRVSFSVKAGDTLGIVGESGCGKSLTSLAIMGLLPSVAQCSARRIDFEGKDIFRASNNERRALRGKSMAMIFQDPMTSLNPSFTVGYQLNEIITGSNSDRSKKAKALLEQVGIPDTEERLNAYPHQLSGGMAQRVMIAIAIAQNPKLLIADEPTTALDVTIQAQILRLMKNLCKERGMALILISHDMAVIAQMSSNIMVMYAGQGVEMGDVDRVISTPSHPYTQGLLSAMPEQAIGSAKSELPSIPGLVPDLASRPAGCQFHPRCSIAKAECQTGVPGWKNEARCFFPLTQEKSTLQKLKDEDE